MDQPTCAWCGAVMTEDAHPLALYCDRTCRSAASYQRTVKASRRKKNADRLAATVKECKGCQEDFIPQLTSKQLFCSRQCANRFQRDSAHRLCSEEGCDRPLRARGMCSMHWRRWARVEGLEKPPAWDDKRRARSQERRALKLQVPTERFTPAEIYERDGWTCGICAQPVDAALAFPDPHSPSLDHIVPLSRGGSHTRGNVQCTHLTCNLSKGARVA